MLRRFAALFLCLTFCFVTVGCSSSASNSSQSPRANVASASDRLSQGKYPVQQAEYDDATGEYSLMLLNTPPGTSPMFRITDLQMARLTPEEVQAGEASYLNVDGSQAVLHLTEDFRIAYVHSVTETQNNPQTGQPQTVIVRRESNFWTPFAGVIAGQAIANMLFTPRYYVPPMYQPGGMMTGYGGYGNTYSQAVQSYQTRHNQPPAAVKNRQTLRTTGSLRSPSTNSSTSRSKPTNTTRSTGSGFGSSNLRTNNKSKPRAKRSSGFGSGGPSRSRARPRRR